jgi:hypothetical protein
MENREHDKFDLAIDTALKELGDLLKDKNRKYGNSITKPVRIFSKVEPIEQVNVRIDDKISRLIFGDANDTEDTEQDLTGYLIIKRALMVLKKTEQTR